ncbi:undecaprenyldiphospho-muramoylpentapeptide beta-N-acetylglucosaminyltransferase [Fulvivirga sedimenti]|uniref:UDP-N-acetylglucosamine--N-acetylmuramyl-(pentapeptide) pyrophosphoryl-undecaprenol N-acetylglucosamine transferase n=1 Tax=Fulvivirga sedimenti TaxID=2879465 RepID=A0A9X1KWF9_9BACT|nr:undecaprenyldiphospho-muramoylpentapeptide beta-N-acetylglucosaminyltransferase [Fulvivirga sedimenti]
MTGGKPYRFIISGGGTGGHIYPALAVAAEIRRRYADSKILFVGAQGKMEMTKVPEAGFEIRGLWISGFQRSLSTRNLMFPFKLIHSWFAARNILREFKPDAVVGFGGYASGPMMLAATGRRIPSMIQEQNSYAGLTNRKLGNRVEKICVAYEGMEKYFPKDKIEITGNPVRKDIIGLETKRQQALTHFGLDDDRPVVLILGGSLGARTINNSVLSHLQLLKDANVQVLWQTGKFYHQEMTEKASAQGDHAGIQVLEFIREMDLAYAASDIVISRAGALSISELCLAGKPVVFVPSSNVAEDHQTKNAKALTSKGAALMVTDEQAPEQLIPTTLELLSDSKQMDELARRIKAMAKPRATEDIVNELEKIIA